MFPPDVAVFPFFPDKKARGFFFAENLQFWATAESVGGIICSCSLWSADAAEDEEKENTYFGQECGTKPDQLPVRLSVPSGLDQSRVPTWSVYFITSSVPCVHSINMQ